MLRSPNRVADLIVGAALLVLGVAGLVGTAAHPESPETVFGVFAGDLAQALVHTVLGAALLAAGLVSVRAGRFAAQLGGTLLLALGIAGLFLVDTPANVLALGASDNLVHFVAAVILLAVGFGADPRTRSPTGTPSSDPPLGEEPRRGVSKPATDTRQVSRRAFGAPQPTERETPTPVG